MKTIVSTLVGLLAFGMVSIADTHAQAASDKPDIEVTLTGRVEKIEVDTCMDGATYNLIYTANGSEVKTRLKPANDSIKAKLDKVTGKRVQVTVSGQPKNSVENCHYVDVDSVKPGADKEQNK